METEGTGKARGGYARAAKLTPEERKEIAQKGAKGRWDKSILKATHDGVLKIGDIEIPCAVLEDGSRVLSERGVTKALGGKRGGAHWRRMKHTEEGAYSPVFISANNIKPFIDKDLEAALSKPISYIATNKKQGNGVLASLLPEVCNVWLKARDKKGALHASQKHIAEMADILMRGLAHVGIVALVDEATGYQAIRPQDALQKYLEMIVRKELASWAKKFPDEFYENIYKLKNWPWPGMKKNRFSVVARYTTDLVYERIAPGLLEELKKKSPKDESGNRKNKLHQWLTEDIGNPMLAQHLHSLVMFQRLALSNGYGWNRFIKMVDKVLPRRGATLELPNLTFSDSTEP